MELGADGDHGMRGSSSPQWKKRELNVSQRCSWHVYSVSACKGKLAPWIPSHFHTSMILQTPHSDICTHLERKMLYWQSRQYLLFTVQLTTEQLSTWKHCCYKTQERFFSPALSSHAGPKRRNCYDIALHPENLKISFLPSLSFCTKSKICNILMVRQAD